MQDGTNTILLAPFTHGTAPKGTAAKEYHREKLGRRINWFLHCRKENNKRSESFASPQYWEGAYMYTFVAINFFPTQITKIYIYGSNSNQIWQYNQLLKP